MQMNRGGKMNVKKEERKEKKEKSQKMNI